MLPKTGSAGLWHCVNGQLFHDVPKDCSPMQMKAVQSLEVSWTLAVQSLEVSRTFCKMTHYCITEDFAFMLYCNQTINWFHLSCYSSCIGGRSRNNSGGGGIGFPYIFFFPRHVFFFLTQKFPSMQVFCICRSVQVFDCLFVPKTFAYFNVTASVENISATF